METKYSEAHLKQAFDIVKDKDDWKAKIICWIRKRDHELVKEAIKFYTATSMWITGSTKSYERIESIGYRRGPCGDN